MCVGAVGGDGAGGPEAGLCLSKPFRYDHLGSSHSQLEWRDRPRVRVHQPEAASAPTTLPVEGRGC